MSTCLFSGLPDGRGRSTTIDAISVKVLHEEQELNYTIMNEVYSTYAQSDLDKWKLTASDKLKILNNIIKLNDSGIVPLFVWDATLFKENPGVKVLEIENIRRAEFDHKYKEEELLTLLSKKLINTSPFSKVSFHLFDLYRLNMLDAKELYRWSNSLVNKGHLVFAKGLSMLNDMGGRKDIPLIEYKREFIGSEVLEITPAGWDKVYDQSRSKNTRNVFIAMAFTDKDGKILPPETREAIKLICRNLGWNPLIVDEVGHNDGVMDKIISLINESHFVITDLTFQKSGVYYEAGYAKAKGLEVIHCVRDDEMEICHFDVKHLNLILWKDLEVLKSRLESRILSTVGRFKESQSS